MGGGVEKLPSLLQEKTENTPRKTRLPICEMLDLQRRFTRMRRNCTASCFYDLLVRARTLQDYTSRLCVFAINNLEESCP